MGPYYYLTTSNNTEETQYKIDLDTLDFGLLPIEKLLGRYQYQKESIKIKIFDAKNRNKLRMDCTNDIKGNHLEYEVVEEENFETKIGESMEIVDSGHDGNLESGSSYIELKYEGNIDSWWESLLAIEDITDSAKNVKDVALGTKSRLRPRPAVFSKNWHKKYGNSGTHTYHDDTYGVLGQSPPAGIEFDSENEFVFMLRYIQPNKETPNIVHCSACEANLTVNKKNVSQHFAGIKHRVLKFKSEMQISAIFQSENEDGYLWCKVCALSFKCNSPGDLYEHIKDRSDHDYRHDKLMELIESEDIDYDDWCKSLTEEDAFCNTCLEHVPFNFNSLKWHINGFRHQESTY